VDKGDSAMTAPARLLRVALDTPLRRLFDYLPAADGDALPEPGCRVRVPFGRRFLVGLVVGHAAASDLPEAKLRRIATVLDAVPLLEPALLSFLEWAAAYYHHPVGPVFAAALPKLLRDGEPAQALSEHWAATAAGRELFASGGPARAPKQRELLGLLVTGGEQDAVALKERLPRWRDAAEALQARGLAESRTTAGGRVRDDGRGSAGAAGTGGDAASDGAAGAVAAASEHTLGDAQQAAVDAIVGGFGRYGSFLLEGVTGSGKTEVYLRAIEAVLARGEAALVLCPEIGLTPQLLARIEARFRTPVAALHSQLTDRERLLAWRAAATGAARIVVGTRSAVFAPLPRLGLIVVDEEHDASFKQHEGGFRYSARDLAILRAARLGVPVVLGSATPSFESLHNVDVGKSQRLSLPRRAGAAEPPRIALVDLRAHAATHGIATPVLQAMERHLTAGGQVLVFINRRGYAPTLLCTGCGWIAPCESCDARMTVHQREGRLACHHCGADEPLPERCPRCGHGVKPVGQGTERVEETLAARFPEAGIARFDRDRLRSHAALEEAFDRVIDGRTRILVGTQMLTKGHHFPDVSLVVVLNADQSLFSSDFRAPERLAQTIVQVAGRAGRAERAGEVLVQSEYPQHPLLQDLLTGGYGGFAKGALPERAAAGWPPFGRLAVLRASGTKPDAALEFLQAARGVAESPAGGAARDVALLGPIPAAMVRRAGRYYAQLLVESRERPALQRFLWGWLPAVEALETPGTLRWVLDVDPLEVF
jgi:primosomal protein N' (replication factor Y) (superfamily II helicase)